VWISAEGDNALLSLPEGRLLSPLVSSLLLTQAMEVNSTVTNIVVMKPLIDLSFCVFIFFDLEFDVLLSVKVRQSMMQG